MSLYMGVFQITTMPSQNVKRLIREPGDRFKCWDCYTTLWKTDSSQFAPENMPGSKFSGCLLLFVSGSPRVPLMIALHFWQWNSLHHPSHDLSRSAYFGAGRHRNQMLPRPVERSQSPWTGCYFQGNNKNPATNLHHHHPKRQTSLQRLPQGAPDPCPNHPRSGLHEVAIILSHLHPNTWRILGGGCLVGGGEIYGEKKKRERVERISHLWYEGWKVWVPLLFSVPHPAIGKWRLRFWELFKKNGEILDHRIVGQGKKNTQDRIHLPMCRRARCSISWGRDIKLQLTCLELVFKNLMALSTKPPSPRLHINLQDFPSQSSFQVYIYKILLQRPHLELTKENLLPSLKRTCPLKK